MPASVPKEPEKTIRLGLGWLTTGLVVMFGAGVLGGLVAQYLLQPTLLPISTDTGRQFVTTVQEVTISPNTALADITARAKRSILLLGRETGTGSVEIVASAFVATSDGLLVTAGSIPDTVTTAFDDTGTAQPISRVGTDALYGLTYFRLRDAVAVPLDVRDKDAPASYALLLQTQNRSSFQPAVVPYVVSTYELPRDSDAPGVQRILIGDVRPGTAAIGSPLLDEEGRVAGMLIDAGSGTVLPVSHLRESLSRVATNQRERNPFEETGLSVDFAWLRLGSGGGVVFTATVIVVTPGGPAADAGIQRGDSITKVNEQRLDWEQMLATALQRAGPIQLSIMRGGQERTVAVSPVRL